MILSPASRMAYSKVAAMLCVCLHAPIGHAQLHRYGSWITQWLQSSNVLGDWYSLRFPGPENAELLDSN